MWLIGKSASLACVRHWVESQPPPPGVGEALKFQLNGVSEEHSGGTGREVRGIAITLWSFD